MQPARVLVADPPWKFGDRLGRRGAAAHYPLMSAEEICSFELPLVASDAYLLLWRVASMQEEALAVARAWGFVPTAEIVWLKLTRHGKPWFGLGHHTRAAHETCLLATRGKVRPRRHNVRSTFS